MPIPAPPPGTYAENGTGRVAQPTSHTPNSPPAVPAAAPKAKAPAITYVEFAAAVKDALRDVHSPDLLARNPLLRDGLCNFGGSAGPQELKALLCETVGTLFGNARDEKLRRILELTYSQHSLKQEAVADRLALSFGTYRRHLSNARERMARWLWETSHLAPIQSELPSAGGPSAKEEKPGGETAISPEAGGPASPSQPALPLPDKPSIAVLPFANMSGDPEQEYFADGMVEEIITALSRIRWLFVIARNSSFTYKGQRVDVKQVGRELGVHYVLEGSVRKAASRVRITAQLIDAITGAQLWADRFDGFLGDVFDLQDKVASSVAGVIEPALQAAETARSANHPTDDLTAYDLYLRAYSITLSSAKQIPQALRLLDQAIARDPRFGPALALAAFCSVRLLRDGRSEDPEADRLKGADFARGALEVARDDPGILANAGFALAYLGEDIGSMMALVDRALALNPSFARGWHISSTLRLWAGQLDIAIEHAEASLHLSPRARVGPSLIIIGGAHFFSRRFEEAVPKLLLAMQEDPSLPASYRLLGACYAHMGLFDEAREIVERLRAITPVVVPSAGPFRNPEHRELYLSGLRLATGGAT
jgi:TolB-like protein